MRAMRESRHDDELASRSPGLHVGVGFGDLFQTVCPVDRHVSIARCDGIEKALEDLGGEIACIPAI
jgi:hypothetical protein